MHGHWMSQERLEEPDLHMHWKGQDWAAAAALEIFTTQLNDGTVHLYVQEIAEIKSQLNVHLITKI